MTVDTKTQIRGNCQCCGRQHAYQRGAIAKHGYTVDNGYFNGVCTGNQYEPIQLDRKMTDTIVAMVRGQVADARSRADALESGKVKLGMVRQPGQIVRRGVEPVMVEFSTLRYWEQIDALTSAVWQLRSRANSGESFANQMAGLADALHGKPLIEVPVESGPAPIQYGEKRIDAYGAVMTVNRIDRGRVYWLRESNGKSQRGWTGSAAWRRFELSK
ncbi:hypothetical protein HOV04_gp62 [Xanthomonas phage XcP1]|uniref:Uncharacterized protein n=1 Tax=Xanthomonas phage XcP1 TaxID=2785027 RepID=A0A3S7L8N1_9CAUD|nr:hypothetical protein HOV04_gp62 [Xanthomonas phage XcP1]AWN08564.1 hypothetical protein XcP1_062 [Xanthomonas phage XcP1]